MNDNISRQKQYRKIAKNTVVLGGAQIVQMLVTLIRTKVIAVLLGSTGMGVNALILSAVSTIQQFSSLGIFQSGVRELSQIYDNGDTAQFARFRRVFNRLTLLSGLLGLVICLMMSNLLSDFSFGNSDYTWAFASVSISLLFMSLQSGVITILQATQNMKLIAKATMTGAVLNLVITVPMFYFWRMDSIVPAIILSYAMFYFVNKYFESKIVFVPINNLSKAQFIGLAKPILKLGLVLMVSNLMMVTFTFLLNGFISRFGSVSDVGLFQAAASICMQSMVIINTTLASDYFPRLSAVHSNHELMSDTINQQTETTLMMIVPISTLLFLFAPTVVRLLFDQEYLVIVPMLQIMLLSLIFRALWMIMGFVVLAKGEKKMYLIYDAFIGHGINFVLNILSFMLFAVYGLGISYSIGAIIMTFILGIVLKTKYNFIFKKNLLIRIIIIIIIIAILYISENILFGLQKKMVTNLIVVLMICYCMYRLNKLLNISGTVSKMKLK